MVGALQPLLSGSNSRSYFSPQSVRSLIKHAHFLDSRTPDWLKMKNPDAPAVKREAEEEWGRR